MLPMIDDSLLKKGRYSAKLFEIRICLADDLIYLEECYYFTTFQKYILEFSAECLPSHYYSPHRIWNRVFICAKISSGITSPKAHPWGRYPSGKALPNFIMNVWFPAVKFRVLGGP